MCKKVGMCLAAFLAVFCVCCVHLAAVSAAPSIQAASVASTGELDKGDAITVPLAEYWRSNVVVSGGVITGEKRDVASHVPGLIEYALDIETGGAYDIQAKYRVASPSPTKLAIDGGEPDMIFSRAKDATNDWETVGSASLASGRHRLRFTSRYVETPFPEIQALRLVYRGGPVPLPEPEPEVVGYRAELPADWWHDFSRKIHGDFHTGGFVKGVGKKFDPVEYANTLSDNGVNAICIFAKGHHGYAFYNTKVGTRHPGLDFDLMKAQIDACHAKGIKVWVYLSIAIDEMYGSTQENQAAKVTDHFIRVSAETDTRYVRDYTWPMIVECVRDYDIDGFFFDFPGNEAFVQETITLIKSIKPGIPIAYNHQWDKSREELAKLDILEIESWMHKQTLYHWQYVARYARGAVPLTAMTTAFWVGWGDFGGIADEAMLRYDVATGLANGCAITIGDQLHPHGRLDEAMYGRIGRAFDYAVAAEPYVFDSESIPYVALLKQSEPTCAALIDAGIHFSVVDETQDLSPFSALVIPDASKIDDTYVAEIERFIRNGGGLLASGEPTPSMARLLGVKPDEKVEPEAAYIRIDNDVLPTPPASDLYTYRGLFAVRADDADVLAPTVWAMNHGTIHHVSHRQSPPMETASEYAAVTERRHGGGRACYVAAPVFDIYASMGWTAMRDIVSDLVTRMIPPERRIGVEAPVTLEVSANRQGEKTIVHLVHCSQSRRAVSSFDGDDYVRREPVIDGVPTVSGAKLVVPAEYVKGRTITEVVTNKSVNGVVMNGDGSATVLVPDFEIGTVLAFE